MNLHTNIEGTPIRGVSFFGALSKKDVYLNMQYLKYEY